MYLWHDSKVRQKQLQNPTWRVLSRLEGRKKWAKKMITNSANWFCDLG